MSVTNRFLLEPPQPDPISSLHKGATSWSEFPQPSLEPHRPSTTDSKRPLYWWWFLWPALHCLKYGSQTGPQNSMYTEWLWGRWASKEGQGNRVSLAPGTSSDVTLMFPVRSWQSSLKFCIPTLWRRFWTGCFKQATKVRLRQAWVGTDRPTDLRLLADDEYAKLKLSTCHLQVNIANIICPEFLTRDLVCLCAGYSGNRWSVSQTESIRGTEPCMLSEGWLLHLLHAVWNPQGLHEHILRPLWIGMQAHFLPLLWTAAAWPSMLQAPNSHEHLILASDTVVSWPLLGFPGICQENTSPTQGNSLSTQQISSN
jgi:hypothetical protein